MKKNERNFQRKMIFFINSSLNCDEVNLFLSLCYGFYVDIIFKVLSIFLRKKLSMIY